MDPLTIATVAGAGVSLLARLIGEAIAAGDYDKAQKLREQALAEYGDEILPQLEQEVAQEVDKTGLASLNLDAAPRNAQMDALARLAQLSTGEMTMADQAEQRRAMEAAGGVAARQTAAGEQLAAARGLQRSGLSQVLGEQAAQVGAQTAADQAAQMAGDRQSRALRALTQYGQLGGDVRGQDYQQAARAAEAQDAINRFNANMRADAARRRNQNQLAQFDTRMGLRDARNSVRGSMAGFYEGRAGRNRETAKDIGQGFQRGVDTWAGDERDRRKKP